MTWVGSDSHFAILAVLALNGLVELLLRWLRRPHNHHVPHRKLRAFAAWRGPAAGSHAPSTAPAAGAQLSREFWHQEWLAEHHQRFTHRGSAVRSVEPPPAVGTSGSTSTAGSKPRTPVRSGSAAPRSCGPHPVVAADMAPTTGPKQPVGVGAPRHGADRCSTPQPGEIHEGHEGAVVREATAPARSAA